MWKLLSVSTDVFYLEEKEEVEDDPLSGLQLPNASILPWTMQGAWLRAMRRPWDPAEHSDSVI